MLQAERMVALNAEAEKASELGEEAANLNEKLVEECLKYCKTKDNHYPLARLQADTLTLSTAATSNKPGTRT
jgi:hypothetical protein